VSNEKPAREKKKRKQTQTENGKNRKGMHTQIG
jgi:hypothetical protein